MKAKHETLVADDLFYVFVDVGKQPSDPTESYVLPSRVVADCIRDSTEFGSLRPARAVNHTRTAPCVGCCQTTLTSSRSQRREGTSSIGIGRVGWIIIARTGGSWDYLRRTAFRSLASRRGPIA